VDALEHSAETHATMMADFVLARNAVAFAWAARDSRGISEKDSKALGVTRGVLEETTKAYEAAVEEKDFEAALWQGGSAVRRGRKAVKQATG